MTDDLIARLRAFECSDELGNGDFSVCREAAAEIERLRAGLEDISEGRCIVDWAHKAEKQFEAFAEDVLAGREVRLVNCAACDGAGCDLYGDNPQRDCTVCNGRGKVPLPEGAE